jgi:adenylosuccinate lyase
MTLKDRFDCVSPIDYRYGDEEAKTYLSERAFVRYKLQVEVALVHELCRRGVCSGAVADEIERATSQVTCQEVYEEEDRIHHDIRALVNCIRARVSDEAKPIVHMAATSYDIVDTANAMRFQDVVTHVFLPNLDELTRELREVAIREADTKQIGRTHGQHAVPITFGYCMSGYVARLAHLSDEVEEAAFRLCGKFSGAVGAYNSLSLFVDDPRAFERSLLENGCGVRQSVHATQIVPPEFMARFMMNVVLVGGVLADLADDLRHLQRTEIAEVGEVFEVDQVGSSTMPHKRNPINLENVKSMWKIVMPRMVTVLMDQLSEHQRDLTNSASSRTYGETIAYVISMMTRLTRTVKKLVVDRDALQRNLNATAGGIAAEPLYLILASLGHPDAHEVVRKLTRTAREEDRTLWQAACADASLAPYLERITTEQRVMIVDPTQYTGIAEQRTREIVKT